MSRAITAGAAGGLAGGLVFAALMRIMPDAAVQTSMIDFAADAVHVADRLVGWFVYVIYGVATGALFGWLRRDSRGDDMSAVVWGGLYGVGWWVIAEIVLVPALSGLWPLSIPAVARGRDVALPLLIGHVAAGTAMGLAWAWITRWTSRNRGEDLEESSTRHAA